MDSEAISCGNVRRVRRDPDVFEVRVPHRGIKSAATNCYVVRDGCASLIVDTGNNSDFARERLLSGLGEIGVDLSQASFFLTHLHLDHIGLMNVVAPCGSTVYLARQDLDTLNKLASGELRSGLLMELLQEGIPAQEAALYVEVHHGFSTYDMLDPTRFALRCVEDGEDIFVGRYRFRVVATPGHTPGHLSLLFPEGDVLFGGDHILGRLAPSIACLGGRTRGVEQYFRSLEKVARLPFSELLVAHGEGLSRAEALTRIAWLADHQWEHLRDVVQFARERGGVTAYEATRYVDWNVPASQWTDIRPEQRWCIISQGLAMVDFLVEKRLLKATRGADGVIRYR